MQNVTLTLNDIKSLILSETIPLEVFICVIDDGGNAFHVFSGQFKDVPLDVLSLPVNGIFPSSKNALDIYLDKEGVV